MARTLRIEYPGAVYHVMARGNQGRPIYGDDPARKVWLETLAEAVGAEKSATRQPDVGSGTAGLDLPRW
jgi:hypothetical protein